MVHVLLSTAAIAWIAALALGMRQLGHYQGTPGTPSLAPPHWPADAPPPNTQSFTLAVFIHPECPCSTATLSSLDKLMAHHESTITLYVFAVLPEGAPPEWKTSPLITSARQIPTVHLVEDPGGHFAHEFNAQTSGQVALYDATGICLFSGGITAGRGHEGPNAGLDQIESLVTTPPRKTPHETSQTPQTPVFGCSLFDECPPTPQKK